MSVGHSFKYGEDVDKSYHEINVNSEKRINLNNVLVKLRQSDPMPYTGYI